MSLAVSFDNHLFHKAPWKSELFPGRQVPWQSAEQGSAGLHCLCCCHSNYIYYRESCQGRDSGAKRIKRKQQLDHTDSVRVTD